MSRPSQKPGLPTTNCSPINDSLGMNMVIEIPKHLMKNEIRIHLMAVVNPFFGPTHLLRVCVGHTTRRQATGVHC
jgi:hypothetical protein